MKIKKINSFEIKTQVILSDTAEMDSIMLLTMNRNIYVSGVYL